MIFVLEENDIRFLNVFFFFFSWLVSLPPTVGWTKKWKGGIVCSVLSKTLALCCRWLSFRIANARFFKQMQLLTILSDMHIAPFRSPSQSASQKRPHCIYINASQSTNSTHLLGLTVCGFPLPKPRGKKSNNPCYTAANCCRSCVHACLDSKSFVQLCSVLLSSLLASSSYAPYWDSIISSLHCVENQGFGLCKRENKI